MTRRGYGFAGFLLVLACTTEGRPQNGPITIGSGPPGLGSDGATTEASADPETDAESDAESDADSDSDADADADASVGSTDDGGFPATTDPSDPTTGPAADEGGAPTCNAPDVLVVLDRTQSMHRRPDGSVPVNSAVGRLESKWFIAIDTLERVTKDLESSVNFGLELFPREPVDASCVTLQERIAGVLATNPACEEGELFLAPQADAAAAFALSLDHETTRLCDTTPVGHAIESAVPILAAVADPDREQFVVLVSDGNETCESQPVGAIHLLAAAGIRVHVVGFGDILETPGHARLNRMACAGQTAIGFPAPCVDLGGGNYDAADSEGDPVYLAAEDADALGDAFDTITADLCCGSACVPG